MEKTAVFLGDSITDSDRLWDDGPDSLGFGYVRKIKEGLPAGEPLKIYNRGHNGFTAFQVRERLSEDLSGLFPDTVTLLVGINDLSRFLFGGGYGAEGFREQMEHILEFLKQRRISRIILMEPFVFPFPDMYRGWEKPLYPFQEQIRFLADFYRTGFVALSDIFRKKMETCPPWELTTDGVHLTKEGHGIVAKAWEEEYFSLERL